MELAIPLNLAEEDASIEEDDILCDVEMIDEGN